MPALLVLEHTLYIYACICTHTYKEINVCIYICKYVYIHGFKVKVKLYNTISWGGMQIEYVSVFVLVQN